MRKPPDSPRPPLLDLARGFRKRTLVTARVMAKVGVRMAKANLGMGELADSLDSEGEEDAVAAARELLEQLDGLKGLTMKVGQMMSYLDSSLPPKARRVLARLQSASRPLAPEAIAAVIQDELSGAPDEVFDRFEPQPFAAASIGQVHRAWLGGQALAVKVQYPGVEDLLRADVSTIGKLARLATLVSPVDGGALVAELAGRVLEECDYLAEARNQDLFRSLLAGHPDVSVPAVRADRTTRRVLTSEHIDRAGFDAFCAGAPRPARDRAGTAIYDACFTTIFRHGAYNADPHPGNYLFAPDGAVTLLDFGCVKRFEPDFIAAWKRLARSIIDADRAAFRRAWTDVGFVGRARGFDFDHQYDAMRFLYQPMTSREPWTFTPAYIAGVHDHLIFKNKNKRKLDLPPDWLFINRLQFGLFSVLSQLGSTIQVGQLFRSAVSS